jgi:hypothetical protein
MKYQLKSNLGTIDARYCNDECGASLSLEPADLAAGSVVDLPQRAADYLTKTRGMVSLLEPAGKVTGESKKSEITGPAK